MKIQKSLPDKMNSRSFGIDRSWVSKGSRLVLTATTAFIAATANQALSPVRGAGFKQDRSETSLDFIVVIRWGQIAQKVGVDCQLRWLVVLYLNMPHLEAARVSTITSDKKTEQ